MSTSLPVCRSGILFLRKSEVSVYEGGDRGNLKMRRACHELILRRLMSHAFFWRSR